MHIKQIIVEGFKTYKDRTVIDNLSPGANAIVGPNGSGKSNIFAAIEFLLSNEFATLTPDERRALLHEGAGHQSAAASVEIIFDNADGRIPVERRDTVSLRRTMGTKKDEYFLDGKHITRSEVVSLLESAGLSRSNPYYIVQQGKVAKLIKMRDAERLDLLMEIAGTRTYDERRAESLRVMAETDAKRKEVAEVLASIEKRVAELEAEKTALRAFQDADADRRALEHALLSRRERRLAEALAALDAARAAAGDQSAQLHAAAAAAAKESQAAAAELARAGDAAAEVQGRRAGLEQTRQTRAVALAQAEAAAREAADARAAAEEAAGSARRERAELLAQIEAARGEVTRAEAAATAAATAASEARARSGLLEQRKLQLQAKQGRAEQFADKKARDAHLTAQIKALEKEAAAADAAAAAAEKDAAAAETARAAAAAVANAKPSEVAAGEAALASLERDAAAARVEQDAAQNARREAWRALEAAEAAVKDAVARTEAARRDAQATMDREVFRGLEAVRRLAREHGIAGVHGPLVDLIQCDKLFQPCVETVAGGALFHVVVDSDAVAAKLIALLNREKAGRVTFMPLSQLREWPVRYPQRQDCLPMLQRLTFDPRHRAAVFQVFGRTVIVRSLPVGSEVSKSHNLDCITAGCERVSRRGALTGGFVDTDVSRLRRAHAHREAITAQTAAEAEVARLRTAVDDADARVTAFMSSLAKLAQARAAAAEKVRAAQTLATDAAAEARALADAAAAKRVAAATAAASRALLQEQLDAHRAEIKAPFDAELGAKDRRALADITAEAAAAGTAANDAAGAEAEAAVRADRARAHLEGFLLRRLAEVQAAEARALAAAGEAADAAAAAETDLRAAKAGAEEARAALKAAERDEAAAAEAVTAAGKRADEARAAEAGAHKDAADASQSAGQVLGRAAVLEQQLGETRRDMAALGALPAAALDAFANTPLRELEEKLSRAVAAVAKHAGVNKRAPEQAAELKQQREELEARRKEIDRGRASIVELIEGLDLKKDEAIDRTFKAIGQHFSQVFAELVPGGKGTLVLHSRAGAGAGATAAAGEATDLAQGGGRMRDDDDDDNKAGSESESDSEQEEEEESADEGEDARAGSRRKRKAPGAAGAAGKSRKSISAATAGARSPGRASSSSSSASASASAQEERKESKEGKRDKKKSEEDRTGARLAALAGAGGSALRFSGVGIRVAFSGQKQQATALLSGGQQCVVALSLIFAIQRCDPSPFYVFDEIDANLDAVHRTAVAALLAKQKATTQFVVTTFRPEFLTAMDRFYGVRFLNKTSVVREIGRAEAQALVNSGESAPPAAAAAVAGAGK